MASGCAGSPFSPTILPSTLVSRRNKHERSLRPGKYAYPSLSRPLLGAAPGWFLKKNMGLDTDVRKPGSRAECDAEQNTPRFSMIGFSIGANLEMTFPPPGTRDACPTISFRGAGPACGAAVPAAGWVGTQNSKLKTQNPTLRTSPGGCTEIQNPKSTIQNPQGRAGGNSKFEISYNRPAGNASPC